MTDISKDYLHLDDHAKQITDTPVHVYIYTTTTIAADKITTAKMTLAHISIHDNLAIL